MLKAAIAFVAVAALTSATLWYTGFPWRSGENEPPGDGGEIACTMEAKLCPDGSYVGRTGPTCEFAACPTATSTPPGSNTGVLTGHVTTSPTCPVERMPPDPKCAPRPYAGRVEVRRAGQETILTYGTSEPSKGYFAFMVPPGSYEVRAVGGNPFPSCGSTIVNISANATTSVELSCDTGIR